MIPYTSQYDTLSSPPESPPIATPGVSLAAISSQHNFLNSRSSPPWMMQNKFCDSGFLWAAMQRSSHLIERSIASFMRAMSGDVVAITSSSCMIMSEPMVFWRDMECSGVRSLCTLLSITQMNYGLESWGVLRKARESLTLGCHRVDSRSAHLLP